MSCIPEFRLPQLVVQKETSILEKMGVEVLYNTRVGKDVSLDQILDQYQAVILATEHRFRKSWACREKMPPMFMKPWTI